jgi:RimJ/RimL family protein N-acetyltransferase
MPNSKSAVMITTKSLELKLLTKAEVLLEYEQASAEDKRQVAPEWLARVENSRESDPWVHGFKMVRRRDGIAIGRCGFVGPPDDAGMVEIAYEVDEAFRGQGYASEAAMGLISYGLGDSRVRVIRAHTLAQENASTHVLRKCGFARVGDSMDHALGVVWRWERGRLG